MDRFWYRAGVEKLPIYQGLVTLLHICKVIPTQLLLILLETLCHYCRASIAALNADIATLSADVAESNADIVILNSECLSVS